MPFLQNITLLSEICLKLSINKQLKTNKQIKIIIIITKNITYIQTMNALNMQNAC